MIKHIFAALTLTMVSQTWASSAMLKGIVTLNHERGAPVSGVEISAHGANPVTTGNDGQFVLIFPNGRPGQDVRLGVKRTGWTVVNDILLDHRLPGDAAVRPFEIIVCKNAERELRVAEFYRLRIDKVIERNYSAKLAELEGRQAATAQERDRLLRERDQARQQYEEALKISRDLAQKNPDVYLLTVATTLNNLGVLHSAENRMVEARKAYDEALGLYRDLTQKNPDVYLPDVAQTLNNLGVLHRAENRMVEARKAYEEALKISRDLAQKNPDVYLPTVATTLNNLGILHSDENRMAEARKAYEEALKIYRDLTQQNSDVYLPYVATTLNNLGVLHRAENRMAEARKAHEEALSIYRRFLARAPERYESKVRIVERNLAELPQ